MDHETAIGTPLRRGEESSSCGRLGDWMITFTGRRFWPLDPRPEEVSFVDVAHGLARICRYNGQCRHFYSVAEHSHLLAHYFERQGRLDAARFALLHDAAEAYIGDMVRPLKHSGMDQFRAADAAIERAVFAAAGLAGDIPQAVHQADTAIIANEAIALFDAAKIEGAGWVLPTPLRGIKLLTDDSLDAEYMFAKAFKRLFPEREYT